MSFERNCFCALWVWQVTVGWTWGTELGLWGVPPDRIDLYQSEKDFKCDGGSVSLSFNKVNDDFCDCEDGADEPATAACTNGVFYCGATARTSVSSSRINDGICDCCDGSDEYLLGTCVNYCEATSVDWIDEPTIEHPHIESDDLPPHLVHMDRRELVEKLHEAKLKVEKLKLELQNAEAAALKTNNQYDCDSCPTDESIEDKYVQEAFGELDLNKNGILELEEVKSDQIFDFNKDGLVEDREIKWYYNAMPAIANIQTFQTKMWKMIGRLYVLEKEMNKSLSFEVTLQQEKEPKTLDVEEEVLNRRKREKDLDIDEDEIEEPIENEESANESEHHTNEAVTETEEIHEKLTSARKKLADAEKWENTMKTMYENQKKRKLRNDNFFEHLDNFGTKERYEFFPEKTICFSYRDRNLVYKLCPFYGATQNVKHGVGAGFSLGYWAGWVKEKGEPVMVYEGGSVCENGIQRSTRVNIYCGALNLLVHVEEPRKCEYRMDLRSPAGCHIKHLNVADVAITSHDEL